MLFGRKTGLWDDGARLPAPAPPRSTWEPPDWEPLRRSTSSGGFRPNYGYGRSATPSEETEPDQEEAAASRQRAAAQRPRRTAAPHSPACGPLTQKQDAVLLAAAGRGWAAEESATTIGVRLNTEALWRAVVRHLTDAELTLLATALKKVRQVGTVLVEDGP